MCVFTLAGWAGLSKLIICMGRLRFFISSAGESQCTFTDPPIHYVSGPPLFEGGGHEEMDGFGGWKTIHKSRGCVLCVCPILCVCVCRRHLLGVTGRDSQVSEV